MTIKKPQRPFIPYSIPLGDGEFVRLVLPHDLSEAEAQRICAVVQALAFTDEELATAEAARRQQASGLGALMADWAAVA